MSLDAIVLLIVWTLAPIAIFIGLWVLIRGKLED